MGRSTNKPDIIRTIRCLDELAGYETQAKKRGITGEETLAIADKRKRLSA